MSHIHTYMHVYKVGKKRFVVYVKHRAYFVLLLINVLFSIQMNINLLSPRSVYGYVHTHTGFWDSVKAL